MTDRFPEEMFRHLVDNLNTGVMIDDSQGKIHYANQTFRDIFKLDQKQLKFYDFADLTAPEHRNDLFTLHLRRLAGKSVPGSMDFTGIRTDGSRVPLEASVSMLQSGDTVYFLTILRDLSQETAAAAAISQNRDFETSRRISMSILESFSNHQSVEELREKLEFPCFDPADSSSPMDAGMIVLETAGFIQEIGNSHVKVSVSVDPDIPRVEVSGGLLRHLLRNAARNALEALGDEGRIILRAGIEETSGFPARTESILHDGMWVFIEIRDDGSGMTEEVLKRAPEPFFSTKNRVRHSGMGLFEIFQGMRFIQGYTFLTSAQDSGTVIRLFIPCEPD